MSEETGGSAAASASLPEAANLDWLRKQAKRQLRELRRSDPKAKLADAQFALAKQYGFSSWRALKAHIDAQTENGKYFEAARSGDVQTLASLLDDHPDKLDVRDTPYGWTLLHHAASKGKLPVVDLLLKRGFDVNTRERGDNTYAMHWAAAAGQPEIVRRLADAGGDVVGHGDDHELEVIGWASSWDGCDDAPHRAVVDLLISRGARHHIFSAIAMNLADEVRRIVAADPTALKKRMSRNENHQVPLQFAVRMNRPEMVTLLLDLGADPDATDGSGMSVALYAADATIDQRVIEVLAGRTRQAFLSLAAGDEASADRFLRENRDANANALHLAAKRGHEGAVRWLLERGFDPNARWNHWEAAVTPLHLAAWGGSVAVVRLLLDAGADPAIPDSEFQSGALGWAEHFGQIAVVQMLKARASP
jgi:ankyrin repeat protein